MASGSGGGAASTESLVKAIEEGKKHKMEALLANGVADINGYYNGMTALHWACYHGRTDAVKLLLQHKASVTITEEEGPETPLHYACKLANRQIMEILLSSGADPDAPGWDYQTPLEVVLRKNHVEGMITLLTFGARITDNAYKILWSLTEIDLSSKNLKNVPEWVVHLTSAKKIDLSWNQINVLPVFLTQMPNLRELRLEGNPLESIPAEVKEGGLKRLLVYLKQLEISRVKWNRVKLMFVGKEAVGKTSLLRAFHKHLGSSTKPPAPRKQGTGNLLKGFGRKSKDFAQLSTDGIAMGELAISDSGLNKKSKSDKDGPENDIIFQTYDFGGQLVFYPTHQFFLTARSMYLVIFDVNDQDLHHVRYWIKQIRASTQGVETPVFIVGTHIDSPMCDRSKLHDVARLLSREDTNIRKVVFVSSKTQEGIPELLNELVHGAKRHSFLKQVIPGSYFDLFQILQNMRREGAQAHASSIVELGSSEDVLLTTAPLSARKKDKKEYVRFINWDHMVRLGKSCQIEEDCINEVVSFFHDVGCLVHFDDSFGSLKDLVIIDPQWLADVMKSVISFNNKWVKNGLISEAELRQWIWRDYPPELHASLQRIFERFQILFPLRSGLKEKTLVAPSLLPEECPVELDTVWPARCDRATIHFGRLYHLSFLPIGLFSRLIVRVMHISGVNFVVAWRSGLVLELNSEGQRERLLMQQHLDPDYRISVAVRMESDDPTLEGETVARRCKLLEQVVYNVDSLLMSCVGLGLIKKVLCPLCMTVRAVGCEVGADPGDLDRRSSPRSLSRSNRPRSPEPGEFQTNPSVSSREAIATEDLDAQQPGGEDISDDNDIDGDEDEVTEAEATVPVVSAADLNYQRTRSFSFSSGVVPVVPVVEDGSAFGYREVINAIQAKTKMVCQRAEHEVSPDRAAPDLLLAGVRNIKVCELRKEKVVGEGGFGVVYRGTWNRAVVAIKELSPAAERQLVARGLEVEKNDTKEFKQFDEFRHETFLMSCLEHENVVRLFGICYDPLSMVMEFASRGDLHHLLNSSQLADVKCSHATHADLIGAHAATSSSNLQPVMVNHGDRVAIHRDLLEGELSEVVTTHNMRGVIPSACLKRLPPPLSNERLPWRLRWRIALDVARGMRYLHSFRPPIVHRDLRSPNVFLISMSPEAPVVAKIGDFGLARHVNAALDEGLRTWQWLAPEVLSHKRVEYDERSDIYSFGIVLWEIATRQTPYTTEYWDKFQRNGYFQAMDCRNAIVDGTCRPTPPPESSGCPTSFADLMQACWRHNPDERPSFEAIVRTIEEEMAKIPPEDRRQRSKLTKPPL